MKRIVALTIATVLAGGCADRGIVDSPTSLAVGPDATVVDAMGGPGLTVMTWNVYYGTDPSPLLVVTDPSNLPEAAVPVWAQAQFTDFPARAGALARAIAAKRPDLVGVQEAALYRVQFPSDFFERLKVGIVAPNATTVQWDFLKLLKDSLAARGLHYDVAINDSTTDVEVPVATDSGLLDVRLTDRDAVLAREGVSIANAKADTFSASAAFGLGSVKEGWASVEATLGGRVYRFVSTHLEIKEFGPIQGMQAQELAGLLASETRPTIVVGDFNSERNGQDPFAPSYGIMTEAGFADSWLRGGGSPPGLTCCQNDSVSNKLSTFNQRVDFIFTRNMPSTTPAGSLVLARSVVGDQRGDRTKSGLWPSDHGGVVATFLTPPAGHR